MGRMKKTSSLKKILVTGGAGFIGSNLVHYLQNEANSESDAPETLVFDALTYAGKMENLDHLRFPKKNTFIHADVTDAKAVDEAVGACDAVFHLAAESHVDRSISNPSIFLETNVLGSLNVLESCRKFGKRVVLVSTDEVYGSLDVEFADENFPLKHWSLPKRR